MFYKVCLQKDVEMPPTVATVELQELPMAAPVISSVVENGIHENGASECLIVETTTVNITMMENRAENVALGEPVEVQVYTMTKEMTVVPVGESMTMDGDFGKGDADRSFVCTSNPLDMSSDTIIDHAM